MKLRKKRKTKKINIILFIVIILIFSIFYLLKIFSEKAIPIFLNYSEIEVKRIASLIINNSVINNIGSNVTLDDLFIIKEDDSGNIISMDMNPPKVNELLVKSSNMLEQNFKYIETGEIDKLQIDNLQLKSNKKGVIYEIPSGIIFNNVFLNNLLPKIPVKLNLIGTIFTKLTTDVESYGINNAIFKVNIFVSSELKIILPFINKNVKLETTIPIIIKILGGKVPNYYFKNS